MPLVHRSAAASDTVAVQARGSTMVGLQTLVDHEASGHGAIDALAATRKEWPGMVSTDRSAALPKGYSSIKIEEARARGSSAEDFDKIVRHGLYLANPQEVAARYTMIFSAMQRAGIDPTTVRFSSINNFNMAQTGFIDQTPYALFPEAAARMLYQAREQAPAAGPRKKTKR